MLSCSICCVIKTRVDHNGLCKDCRNTQTHHPSESIQNITSINNPLCDENSSVYFIDSSGKQVTINVDDNIQIEKSPVFNPDESFKDSLLASLYSQVEFLRSEMTEKN